MTTASETKPLLAFRRLSIQAGGRVLLRNLDERILPGDCLGVTGPSGCGKSTLLRVVSGLDDPADGEIAFRGAPLANASLVAYRSEVLLVAQTPVLAEQSVRDNLARPFGYRSHREKTFHEATAVILLEQLNLGADSLNAQASSLSVGERQRVCFVRALLLEPQVLLLDEPTSALDDDARAAVERIVRERMGEGCAVVLATHDAAQAQRISTRIIDLADYAP